MPESRNRHKHHHHVQSHKTPAKPKRSAALVLAIVAAIFGLAVAFFTQGADVVWMIVGAAAGAIIGYLVGHNMDKAIERNN